MKQRHNGRYVFIRTQDDWEEFQTLRCVCGHYAVDHEYSYLIGSSQIIEIGKCKSEHCSQFKLTGKIETYNAYHYV